MQNWLNLIFYFINLMLLLLLLYFNNMIKLNNKIVAISLYIRSLHIHLTPPISFWKTYGHTNYTLEHSQLLI